MTLSGGEFSGLEPAAPPCVSFPSLTRLALVATTLALVSCAIAPALRAQGTITLQRQDYALAPITGLNNASDNSVDLARINFLREEPGPGPNLNRFFVCDLNGKLYILDQTTKQFATYLDFNRNTAETPGVTGLFPMFTRAAGCANGLVTFQFDPEYRTAGSPNFGKFYTVHTRAAPWHSPSKRPAPPPTSGNATTPRSPAP